MTTCVRQYQIGKTSLDLNEARDDGVLECSGISWTIQYANMCNISCKNDRKFLA